MNTRSQRIRCIWVSIGVSMLMPLVTLAAFSVTDTDDIRVQIDLLNKQVQEKKETLEQVNESIKKYQRLVSQKRAASASLEDEVALLDNRITKTQLAIGITTDELASLRLEITQIDAMLSRGDKKLVEDKALLAAAARKLYRLEQRKSPVELLFSHSTFSEFFTELGLLVQVHEAVASTAKKLQDTQIQLQTEQTMRVKKQRTIEEKKLVLENAKNDLAELRDTKQSFLAQTRSSELEYRMLLAELKNEQQTADSEILYLEKTLRDKVAVIGRIGAGQTILAWPVTPARGITTRFNDPDYPFRYIFEHPGIDIRAGQGTPVRAAAAGVVARAKDAGMGYSYVMILHKNGISTVYGHLSKVGVKEDTYVNKGDVIGYSGGKPGTPGAGKLTTGPHLHLEVRQNGAPVDPMKFLAAL